jgi:hypothetical protein
MVYTFKNLRDQVLRWIDEIGETTTDELVKEVMNQAHQQRCVERGWKFMLHPTTHTITTVENQRVYTLHQEFDRPLYFYNSTDECFLIERPDQQLTEIAETLDNTSPTGDKVENFMFIGSSQFKDQPSSASVITVVSNHASDSGVGYEVVIKGELADGTVGAEVLSLSGLTPVSTTLQFVHVLGLTKSQSFNGTITVTAGATTLLTLLPWEMGRAYKQIYLLDNPPAGKSIQYRFYHLPLVLINDYDIPHIPSTYAQILVWDTLILIGQGYLTSIPGNSMTVWSNMQKSWEYSLYSSELVGQSVGSMPQFFKDLRGE